MISHLQFHFIAHEKFIWLSLRILKVNKCLGITTSVKVHTWNLTIFVKYIPVHRTKYEVCH